SKTYPVKTERIRDMKKILMFVINGFLLIVAVIGVGSKIYIDKRAEQKEAEKIEAERMSVEALKNTFEDIKSVKIEKDGYNEMTSYGVENRKIQVKGVTKNKIHVMYSNRKEEET